MLCAYTRPRYQVSVYRTIGPLVSYFTSDDFCSDINEIMLSTSNQIAKMHGLTSH